MWDTLLTAGALVLVIEGMLPFANPEAWQRAMRRIVDGDPAQLRLAGLGSMLVGTLVLAFLH